MNVFERQAINFLYDCAESDVETIVSGAQGIILGAQITLERRERPSDDVLLARKIVSKICGGNNYAGWQKELERGFHDDSDRMRIALAALNHER